MKRPRLPYPFLLVGILISLCLALLIIPLFGKRPITVGSKKFTEGVVLGEVASLQMRQTGVPVEHRKQLGGTQILWKALLNGDIDVYAEYTGTIREDIFRDNEDLEKALATHGIRMSRPLGFNNSYALGMRRAEANRRNIKTIDDLIEHADLRFGFSEEFSNRADGWRSLRQHYRLSPPAEKIKVLDHELALKALKAGNLDVMDVYTTEGAIRTNDLIALEDNRKFFPRYDAVWLYRADLPQTQRDALLLLEGHITEAEIAAMNASVSETKPEIVVAANFLRNKLESTVLTQPESLTQALIKQTREHLQLVAVSLLAAILVAIPLGILASRSPLFGQGILILTGLLQTIPSLALLAFLVPLLHLGIWPAIVALFLYSLLPIVRNTYTGLRDISPSLLESAQVLGLPPSAILQRIELPLASRSVLAGIKTAAVINVGTATLGALVGAGGYGQPILEGIRIGSNHRIAEGAIPAALLAVLVLILFEIIERRFTPRGLRLR